MPLSTLIEANSRFAISLPEVDQTERIRTALGVKGGRLPRVDEDSLARYYRYLAARLPLPFAAYYPEPMNPRERTEFHCSVEELLDPAQHLGDEFDGIYCRVRKGDFTVNLPLIELHAPADSVQSQLIEDYWYWFWNWR